MAKSHHIDTASKEDATNLYCESREYELVEIFASIKGEGTQAGIPMLFVRFAGCNLACSYCDTAWRKVNIRMTDEELFNYITTRKPRWVVYTGGEPLIQLTEDLVKPIADAGIRQAIETNATVPNPAIRYMNYIAMSPKRQANGHIHSGLRLIIEENDLVIDEVRTVIRNARDEIINLELPEVTWHTLSPVMMPPDPDVDIEPGEGFGSLVGQPNGEALDRCIELVHRNRHLPARLSLQVHKFIGVR